MKISRLFKMKRKDSLELSDLRNDSKTTNPKIIRDFIYLDIERIRSYVAQFYGGLTTERISNKETKDTVSGTISGGIPLSLNLSADIEKYLLKSNQETKSLHDHIFNEFYQALLSSKSLSSINDDSFVWNEESFTDGSFFMVKGAIQLIDYKYITHIMNAFPSIANDLEHVVSSSPKQNTNNQASEARNIKRQASQMPLKELAKILEEFYGDSLKAKFFPFDNKPDQLFVSSPERAYFRYSPITLMQVYSHLINAGWTSIIQINRGRNLKPIGSLSDSNISIESGIDQIVMALSGIHQVMQGIHFPTVSSTTIAIFRETTIYR
jgi:hypothetical protein